MENYKKESSKVMTTVIAPAAMKRKALSQLNRQRSCSSWDYKRSSKLSKNVGGDKENPEKNASALSKTIVPEEFFERNLATGNTCVVKTNNRNILVAKRKKKFQDGKVKVEDVEVKVEDTEVNVEDAEVKIQDAKVKIENAKVKIEDAKATIEPAKVKIEDVKAKIETAKVKIEDAKARIETAKVKIEDAKAKIETAKVKIEDAKAKIETAKVKIEPAKVKIEPAKVRIEDAKVKDTKVKIEKHAERVAMNKPATKRQLTVKQKLECLMGQIDDLFNGQPTADLGMKKLVTSDTMATVDPYKMDLLVHELKKEDRYNFNAKFPKEFAEQRCFMVSQIIDIAKNNYLDHETLQVGIYIADAFVLNVYQKVKDIDWNILTLTAINIATKSQSYNTKLPIVKEVDDIIYSNNPETRNLIPKLNRMEECILKELKFAIVPPTAIILKDLVISQMDFPTPMMQWLTSEAASVALNDAISYYKLISVPASRKAKLAVRICTTYFMKEFHNYQFLPWDVEKNLPLERDDNYLAALKSVGEFKCREQFLYHISNRRCKKLPSHSLPKSSCPCVVTRSRAP